MHTPNDRARLRAETGCDDATIKRWGRGERVLDATQLRLTRAARKLGIALPAPSNPEPTEPTPPKVAA